LLHWAPQVPTVVNSRLQKRRIAFAVYVGACCAAILLAPTIVGALEPSAGAPSRSGSASAGASAQPPSASVPSRSASAGASEPPPAAEAVHSFEDCDRNGDGWLDKSEAGGVPGLSANFERVDRNRDGKLDREEFARALTFLVGHR